MSRETPEQLLKSIVILALPGRAYNSMTWPSSRRMRPGVPAATESPARPTFCSRAPTVALQDPPSAETSFAQAQMDDGTLRSEPPDGFPRGSVAARD
jgi:hypothetical protein